MDEAMQEGLQALVDVLGLIVRLRVVGRAHLQLHTSKPK
jgi:hypothetical protein